MKEKFSLVGIDGNAFSVISYTAKAMRKSGFTLSEIENYKNDAMSSDYNHLLFLSSVFIDKCNEQ